jgi:hypothetical protein
LAVFLFVIVVGSIDASRITHPHPAHSNAPGAI